MSKFRAKTWFFAFLFASSLHGARTSQDAKTEEYHENGWFRNPTTTVSIANSLPDHQNVTSHCASKDDDLGIHVLPTNGTFQWSFRPNFFMTSFLLCSFSWRDAQGGFKIYEAKRDFPRCRHCSWVVRQDGVYGYTDTKQDYIFFDWPKPPSF
ncbi:hypothetical protein L484_024186 [Morus notabilis]|uniref:S-protein homolog n=1 Tax=Morus notabilis TaxID=981085 RepID=W9RV65_9ROSA|nr:S-protein homolog 6 [Morus notabilis]EXB97324.1 hypothetical protein L484_024186 [Morus notabilis]